MIYPRNISQDILQALDAVPALLINGARQTGKSTLVKEIAYVNRPRAYLTFDDNELLAAAANPQEFVDNLPEYVALDEVQRAPHVFLAIKRSIDCNRKPGRFLLTGSANVLTLPKLSESLAGRMLIYTMWTLSQGEIHSRQDSFVDKVFESNLSLDLEALPWPELATIMSAGGYPEVLTFASGKLRASWFSSYLKTLVERDIKEIVQAEFSVQLPGLIRMLAARAGNLLNIADVSVQSGIPQTTLRRYFAGLEMLFLVVRIPAWLKNVDKRLVKTPKLYVLDSGLLCYLKQIDRARLLADKTAAGPVLENFVLGELLKQVSWSNLQPAIYHFRMHNGREVDFVLEGRDGRIVGLEVKSATSIGTGDFTGLRYLQELAGEKFHRGIVLYAGEHCLNFDQKLQCLPISSLWHLGAKPAFNIFHKDQE